MPLVERQILRRLADVDPRVVDQDVDPPGPIDHSAEDGLDLGFLADVGGQREDIKSGFARERRGGGRRLGRVPADDRHGRAGLGQPLDDPETDPAVAPGDNGDLARQVE